LELSVKKSKAHDFDGDKVYDGTLRVNIPKIDIESKVVGEYILEIEYQGCSDAGICYQPIKETFSFKGRELGTFEKIKKLVKEGNASKIVDVLVNESFVFVLFFSLFLVFFSL
jgi:thiol:disulfide interchange protein DsbD